MEKTVLQQAQVEFGVQPANGVFSELLKRFGPFLAEILLKLILSKQQAGVMQSAPPGVGSSPTLLGGWVASILEDHREEILDLIRSSAAPLLDAGIAALRQSA